jgi:hypothetical protein
MENRQTIGVHPRLSAANMVFSVRRWPTRGKTDGNF